MHVVGAMLGFLIGFVLGLLGGGGSILTVPIFVYVLGFDGKAAIAMSLAVVGTASFVGAVSHWREGHVNVRAAGLFGTVAMAGTYAGTRLATFLSAAQQLTLFASAVFVAAGFMMFGGRSASTGSAGSPVGPTRAALLGAEGLVVGGITGLVGLGGGFLIVPALIWGGLAMPDAVGTSLAAIAMNCLVGFYGYMGQAAISWPAVAMVTVGCVPGIAAGTYTMRYVPQATLRRAFAVFLVGLAIYMLYRRAPA